MVGDTLDGITQCQFIKSFLLKHPEHINTATVP